MKHTWVLVLLAAFATTACNGRPRKGSDDEPKLTGSGHVAVIDLRGGIPEGVVGDGLFPAPAGQTFVELVRNVAQLSDDDDVQSIFVRFRGGLAFHQADELGRQLRAVRKSGTPVICHSHTLDNAGLWFSALACDETWVSAAGSVPTVGIGGELVYLKGAFDKLGVVADMMALGKYKSGAESLTREGPSETSLANLQNTLADMRSQWLDGVATDVKDAEARRMYAEDGPWTPKKAKSLGLMTHVGFEDQALKAAREAGGVSELQSVFGRGYADKRDSPLADLVRLLAGGQERTGGKRRIAVVPAVGSITMAAGGPFGGAEGITASAMVRTLRRLRKDTSVRAVVIRMDSPGGSPLASDLIWRELMRLRDEKPVIVSIGSMAASGGYYIASGATKIVSSPSAIVGSIGVFGGKIVVGGALEKVGINSVQVGANPDPDATARAAHLSSMRLWDEPTRERVRASMQGIYDLFIERVAEGRDLPAGDVRKTAEGEIFLAPVGKKRGLVDELGGVERALELAREMADLPDDCRVTIEGSADSLFEALMLGPDPGASEIKAALARYRERQLAEASILGHEAVKALRPYAAAVGPMLAGEHVVAALPYAVKIR